MELFITTTEILKLIDKNPHDFQSVVLFLSENGLFDM